MSYNPGDRDEDYEDGYQSGKEGDMMDDFVHNVKDIVPIPDRQGEKSYDAGYVDGQEDRFDEENSNYKGDKEIDSEENEETDSDEDSEESTDQENEESDSEEGSEESSDQDDD